MSNTSLILRPDGQLTETQVAMLAEQDAEGEAGYNFSPLTIKFPTGGAIANFVLSDGDSLKAPFNAIVAVAQRKRGYYPGKDPVGGQPPLCAAPDGVTGWFDVDSEQVQAALAAPVRHPALLTLDRERAAGPWACAACPLSKWGTDSAGGSGQACKERRFLLVIVKGWAMPAILSVPPASIKHWDAFASGQRQRGQSYFGRWVEMGLTRGTSTRGTGYAELKITSGAPLTDPEAAEVMQIRAMYAELVRGMEIEGDEYVDSAAISATAEEVAAGDVAF